MKLEVNFSECKNYVEYYFSLPLGDLFYSNWWSDEAPVHDGHEIKEVVKLLNIEVDFEKVEDNFWLPTNNVEVYHSSNNINEFLYFDLLRDEYDQCDMIFVGVRCSRSVERKIFEILLDLYKKGNPRTNFNIDYFNYWLYLKVFNSDFYFYQHEKNRKLLHYNLK